MCDACIFIASPPKWSARLGLVVAVVVLITFAHGFHCLFKSARKQGSIMCMKVCLLFCFQVVCCRLLVLSLVLSLGFAPVSNWLARVYLLFSVYSPALSLFLPLLLLAYVFSIRLLLLCLLLFPPSSFPWLSYFSCFLFP